MSGVFQNIENIDPPNPLIPLASVYPPAGGGHARWVERGWGGNSLIVWKTLDTALYSAYVSTLWIKASIEEALHVCKYIACPWPTVRA
jgi:hypothetical protein